MYNHIKIRHYSSIKLSTSIFPLFNENFEQSPIFRMTLEIAKKPKLFNHFLILFFLFSICSNFLPFARVNSTKLLFFRFSLLRLSVCSEQKFVFLQPLSLTTKNRQITSSNLKKYT